MIVIVIVIVTSTAYEYHLTTCSGQYKRSYEPDEMETSKPQNAPLKTVYPSVKTTKRLLGTRVPNDDHVKQEGECSPGNGKTNNTSRD